MSLESLQQEIKAERAKYAHLSIQFGRVTLDHVNVVGQLFIQAKPEVKKQGKKWPQWLKETCPDISARKIGLYMQVSKKYEELATVANFENFTLNDVQKLLNKTSTRKPRKKRPLEPNPLTNLKRIATQYQECLRLLLDTDLHSDTQEAVEATIEILASTESLTNLVRKKYVNHQRSSANCPSCDSKLFGLESCITCGWNMGQLPILNCPDRSHN